ncbi:MAG: thioredoxin [Candidatus Omnitrophica bacterium]|nr:thioredoxin [Candidatus Omnitrophota bacterium]MDD5574894.1 thioredoxin [Candidatus Omnitrophota bacterium]
MEHNIDDANFESEVLEGNLPVLVDFWAEWCGPCRTMTPVIKQIAKEYSGRLKVCKLNVDKAPGAASRYDIMSIPTLAIFKEGKLIKKIVGALPKTELESAIKPYIK